MPDEIDFDSLREPDAGDSLKLQWSPAIMFVCQWIHEPVATIPFHMIDVTGTVSWEPTDKGFEAKIVYSAIVRELLPGCDSKARTSWKTVLFEEFHGCRHDDIGQLLKEGREPVFAKYFHGDEAYRTEVLRLAPQLAARYDQLILEKATPPGPIRPRAAHQGL